MRVSYSVTCVLSIASEVTRRFATSTSVTSPRTTRTLSWRRRISRVAGATSPGERIPVATW